MREHAIPQDITGYRFHIIGNMTIKQFAEIGAGVLVGFLIYTTNLPVVIKWPLIILAGAIGAGAAFVPIEERPLDHWITTFFKVLYKPTKFFWRREPKVPDPFLYKPADENATTQVEFDLRPARRERIKEYLRSVETPEETNIFDQTETSRINAIMGTFSSVNVVATQVEQNIQKPNLKVRVRTLIVNPDGQGSDPTVSDSTQTLKLVDTMNLSDLPTQGYETVVYNAGARSRLETNQVAGNIAIPDVATITYDTPTTTETTQETPPDTIAAEPIDTRVYVTNTTSESAVTNAQVAITNVDLPFPEVPTEPNKVVGMILRPNSELINDAIVEIQAADGRVVRAVKSNALGQFFITTPLDNGTYTLLVERDGFQFTPQQLTVDGNVLAPVEIRSVV